MTAKRAHKVFVAGQIIWSGLTEAEAIAIVRRYRRQRGLMAYIEAA